MNLHAAEQCAAVSEEGGAGSKSFPRCRLWLCCGWAHRRPIGKAGGANWVESQWDWRYFPPNGLRFPGPTWDPYLGHLRTSSTQRGSSQGQTLRDRRSAKGIYCHIFLGTFGSSDNGIKERKRTRWKSKPEGWELIAAPIPLFLFICFYLLNHFKRTCQRHLLQSHCHAAIIPGHPCSFSQTELLWPC